MVRLNINQEKVHVQLLPVQNKTIQLRNQKMEEKYLKIKELKN